MALAECVEDTGGVLKCVVSWGYPYRVCAFKPQFEGMRAAAAVAVMLVGAVLAQQADYKTALSYSLLFYEAQRSGPLDSTNKVPWRGSSALNDRDGAVDLTGGLYDAGDTMKFMFPMSYTATMLSWGFFEYGSGFSAADQSANFLRALHWFTDFLMKCHPSPDRVYAQVGNVAVDHNYFGPPEFAPPDRPAWALTPDKPGSDLAGEMAAALAAASLVFKATEASYSASLVAKAKSLYTFATTYRGIYSDVVDTDHSYDSDRFDDELGWAAVWLFKATKDNAYLDAATAQWALLDATPANMPAFDWGDKELGLTVLLAVHAADPTPYKEVLEGYLSRVLPGGGGASYTPRGLLMLTEWGSLPAALNTVFAGLVYCDRGITSNADLLAAVEVWATAQITYALGVSGSERSFVVGFGNNPPTQPHHAGAACSSTVCDISDPGPNPHVIYGALVGGPTCDDKYEDIRADFVRNEVACDYNAAYTGIIARFSQGQSVETSHLPPIRQCFPRAPQSHTVELSKTGVTTVVVATVLVAVIGAVACVRRVCRHKVAPTDTEPPRVQVQGPGSQFPVLATVVACGLEVLEVLFRVAGYSAPDSAMEPAQHLINLRALVLRPSKGAYVVVGVVMVWAATLGFRYLDVPWLAGVHADTKRKGATTVVSPKPPTMVAPAPSSRSANTDVDNAALMPSHSSAASRRSDAAPPHSSAASRRGDLGQSRGHPPPTTAVSPPIEPPTTNTVVRSCGAWVVLGVGRWMTRVLFLPAAYLMLNPFLCPIGTTSSSTLTFTTSSCDSASECAGVGYAILLIAAGAGLGEMANVYSVGTLVPLAWSESPWFGVPMPGFLDGNLVRLGLAWTTIILPGFGSMCWAHAILTSLNAVLACMAVIAAKTISTPLSTVVGRGNATVYMAVLVGVNLVPWLFGIAMLAQDHSVSEVLICSTRRGCGTPDGAVAVAMAVIVSVAAFAVMIWTTFCRR